MKKILSNIKSIDKTKLSYHLLAGALIIFFLALSYFRVFDEFEYSTYDLRCKLRPAQPVNKDIVIIEIADDSIDKIGKWPFPRNYHALLIKALNNAGARAIVFDVFFSEPKPEDRMLAEAIRESDNVYLPYVFELSPSSRDKSRIYATGLAEPLVNDLKMATEKTGFINVKPDIDGKVRRLPPFIDYKGVLHPHMTLLAALHSLGYDFKEVKIYPGKKMQVGESLTIPIERDSSIIVNYPDVWGKAFRHYSYVDIVQSYLADVMSQEPSLDLSELKDAICFIGSTASGAPDTHPSPMEPIYPGIGVHTSLYNSVMNRSFVVRLSPWWNLFILIFAWCVTAYVTMKVSKRFAMFSLIIMTLGFAGAAILLFLFKGIWIDVFYPTVTMMGVYIAFTFKKYIEETQKREIIEKELDIAKNIQRSFLPSDIPDVESMEINVKMSTARQVGGDLYDIIQINEDKIGIMLGDVSGKGVPASLYMAKVVSVFKGFAKEGSAGEVLTKVNERLLSEGSTSLFVTLTYMIFDIKNKTVNFASGGHLPNIMVDKDGEVELLDVSEGLPLGMIESPYSEAEVTYEPGSIFILYSDGVTEAMNVKEEMFEEERLVSLAKTLKDASAEEVVNAVHKAVNDFEGKAPQHDDITVMALSILS